MQPRDIFKACDVRGEEYAGVEAIFQACRRQPVKSLLDSSAIEPRIAAALALDGLADQKHTRVTVQTIMCVMHSAQVCIWEFIRGSSSYVFDMGHILSNVYLSLRTSCFVTHEKQSEEFMGRSLAFLYEKYQEGTGDVFTSTLPFSTPVTPRPLPPRRVRPGYTGNQLHRAARQGLAGVTASVLRGGADVEEIDCYCLTPLSMAVSYQHPQVVHELLAGGADVNASNGGVTAMMVSVEVGNVAMTTILLQAGADVNARGMGGDFPLNSAVRANNSAMASLLLKSGADIDMPYVEGATPLLTAVGKGYLDMVTLLLDAGANVNARGKGGRTALHQAAHIGYRGLITKLVSAGADPQLGYTDQRDGFATPLDFLAVDGYADAVHGLMRACNGVQGCGGRTKGMSAFLAGVYHSALDSVLALTTWGVKDNGAGLMIAVDNADEACVRLLTRLWEERRHPKPQGYLDAAFPPEILGAYGVVPKHDFETSLTPLTLAVMQHSKYSSRRIVRHLIDSGADVCPRNTAMPPLRMVEVLLREDTFADDHARQRLASIGWLFSQTDAIRAGSWCWPVCAKGGNVSKSKKKVDKSKKKVDEGFRIMLQGMRRRVGTYQFVPRVQISMV
ncbi:unnamed protein product [Ectocarpus sp. 6 AP-2014]